MSSLPNPLPLLSDDDSKHSQCVTKCGKCSGDGNCESKEDRSEPLLTLPGNVLPTLHSDGSRIWIIPSLAKGVLWKRRRWLAYALIAFFVTLPHLRIGGRPYVLIDIASRQFTFFGHTFYPTDTPLVACLMLMAFFSIMLVTALAGRVWCGWGCPQTVYLEFLFRPIDRFFSNTVGKGGKSKKTLNAFAMAAKFVVYLVCCLFLAHTFLSYFVGTDTLAQWMQSSPTKHPNAFLIMGGATAGLLFNFLYFREQFCMIACPYGRFQSVMLDRASVTGCTGSLRLFHFTRVAEQFQSPLREIEPGLYHAQINVAKLGRWQMELEIHAEGDQHFWEERTLEWIEPTSQDSGSQDSGNLE